VFFTVPYSVFGLIWPRAIGNENAPFDAVAGATGVTVMWLFASNVVAALDGVRVVVPPVILAAKAVPAIAKDATAASTTAMRNRRIGLPFICCRLPDALTPRRGPKLWSPAASAAGGSGRPDFYGSRCVDRIVDVGGRGPGHRVPFEAGHREGHQGGGDRTG